MNNSVNYFEFGHVVQEMSSKDIDILTFSAEQNHLCNFARGPHE